MALFISVVNHNHDEMICNTSTLRDLARSYHVVLKSNSLASAELKKYCLDASIHLIHGKEKKGFGANNNEVFEYCQQRLNISNDDYFLVLNPDVEVELDTINQLIQNVEIDSTEIATINLYRDRELTIYDNSIRRFPSILNPIKSLLKIKRTDYYDKDKITQPTQIDWAAGSFLLFRAEIYKKLKGFDESYFMYYEDVDICKRHKNNSGSIIYYPDCHAFHFAQHSNRHLLSKNFMYYFKSTIRYYFKL